MEFGKEVVLNTIPLIDSTPVDSMNSLEYTNSYNPSNTIKEEQIESKTRKRELSKNSA